jgi:hypothetical protein
VLLAQAVEAEVAALLAGHADKLTDDGRQRLVRERDHPSSNRCAINGKTGHAPILSQVVAGPPGQAGRRHFWGTTILVGINGVRDTTPVPPWRRLHKFLINSKCRRH